MRMRVRRYVWGVGASTFALVAALSAAAQEATPAVEEIVVTGSRLVVSGFEAPTPVTVLSQQALEQTGASAVLDTLNQLPVFRNTSSTTVGSGYSRGFNAVDLRGLGTSRTLVLIDGLRVAPRDVGGIVDTNVIPTGLIERVDIVTGGASAAYGSDAVAGVVNFVLASDLDGVRGGYSFQQAQVGQDIEHAVNFAAGSNFAGGRGHLLFGLDAMINKGVGNVYTLPWTRTEDGIISLGPNRPAGLPAQIMSRDVEYASYTQGGLILDGPLKGTAFGPNAAPFPFQTGLVGGASMISPQQSNYGFVQAGRPKQVKSPLSRATGMLKASFDISDALAAWGRLGYFYSESNGIKQIDQNLTNIIIQIDNPYLPAVTRQAMVANGITRFTMGRVMTDLMSLNSDNTADQWVAAAGLDGEVFSQWNWGISAQRGRATFTPRVTGIPRIPNEYASLYAVPGPNGQPICGEVASNPMLSAAQRLLVDPGCVPTNPFGPMSASQQAIDYVQGGHNSGQITTTTYVQDVLELNLQGSPFSLGAGPVNVATGIAYRRENATYDVDYGAPNDPLTERRYVVGNFVPYTGTTKVTEGYFEAGVSLVKGSAFADAIDLNGAARLTHYNLSGTVSTWKLGATYTKAMFTARGTRSRDIRAPNISESFSTAASTLATGIINRRNGTSGNVPTSGQRAEGLVPERADTWTAGVVLDPDEGWASGIQLSVDYFNIKVNDVITSLSPQNVVDLCLLDNDAQACSRITLDSSVPVGISLIRTAQINAASSLADGVDVNVAYDVPLPDAISGTLNFTANGTWTHRLVTTTSTSSIDDAGSRVPKWNWTFNLTYTQGPFSANARVNAHSKITYDPRLIGPDNPSYSPALPNSINKNTFPPIAYLALGARYRFIETDTGFTEAFLNISNALNQRSPYGYGHPLLNASSANAGHYDVIGRTFRVGARFSY